MRLTSSSFAVLALLKSRGESTPYELKRFLEQSVANFWPIPHTTFYAEPARLATAGYLSERREQGGRRRKLYALTERGAEALERWAHSGEFVAPQLRDEGMLKVFAGADPGPLMAARRDWHRAKLEELDGYLEQVEAAGGLEPMRRALLAGLAYHRALLAEVERFLDGAGESLAEEPAAGGV